MTLFPFAKAMLHIVVCLSVCPSDCLPILCTTKVDQRHVTHRQQVHQI